MTDLALWLAAQLDADEARAKACPGSGEWSADDIGIYGPGLSPEVRAHMAEWDPARVLREIEAKREQVKLHSPSEFGTWVGDDDDQMPACRTCGNLTARFPCKTLRLLASVYADRPGYRDAWRP